MTSRPAPPGHCARRTRRSPRYPSTPPAGRPGASYRGRWPCQIHRAAGRMPARPSSSRSDVHLSHWERSGFPVMDRSNTGILAVFSSWQEFGHRGRRARQPPRRGACARRTRRQLNNSAAAISPGWRAGRGRLGGHESVLGRNPAGFGDLPAAARCQLTTGRSRTYRFISGGPWLLPSPSGCTGRRGSADNWGFAASTRRGRWRGGRS